MVGLLLASSGPIWWLACLSAMLTLYCWPYPILVGRLTLECCSKPLQQQEASSDDGICSGWWGYLLCINLREVYISCIVSMPWVWWVRCLACDQCSYSHDHSRLVGCNVLKWQLLLQFFEQLSGHNLSQLGNLCHWNAILLLFCTVFQPATCHTFLAKLQAHFQIVHGCFDLTNMLLLRWGKDYQDCLWWIVCSVL